MKGLVIWKRPSPVRTGWGPRKLIRRDSNTPFSSKSKVSKVVPRRLSKPCIASLWTLLAASATLRRLTEEGARMTMKSQKDIMGELSR